MKTRLCVFILICCLAPFQKIFSEEYNILAFGAIPDTTKLSTTAIQKAIDACSANGGGQVTIPAGRFKTGSVFLKSNIRLYLEAGAILYGSTSLKDYKTIKTAFISLRTQDSIVQLIYGEDLTNVSICGYGEIDGQGKAFAFQPNDEGITRPHLIRFIRCSDIRVENLSLRNSACWMQHYLACIRVTLRGLRIFNRSNMNNDSMDLDGCKDVTVSDIISDTEDDGITFKSTSGWISENIVVTNCVLSSRWNAIKMGTETNGGFKNVSISNCVIKTTSVFPWNDGITSNPLTGITLLITDGGIMQNIVISNISIDNYDAPIFIRLANRGRSYLRGMPVTKVGTVNDISNDNVRITNAKKNGCAITGIPGYPVENIRLSNISIQFSGEGTKSDFDRVVDEDVKGYPQANQWDALPAYGFFIRHASNVTFNGIEFGTSKPDARPTFFLDDVKGANLLNMQLQSSDISESNIFIKQSQDVIIQGNSIQGKSNCFVKAEGDKTSNVLVFNNVLPLVKQVFSESLGCKDKVKEINNLIK